MADENIVHHLIVEKKLWHYEHMIWNLLAKKVYFDDLNRIYEKIVTNNEPFATNIKL